MKRGVLLIVAVVFLIIFGIVVLLLSRSSGKKVVVSPVLKVWAPFDEKKIYDEMALPFLEANPGLTLDFQYIKADDAKEYEAKVVDAIASGKGPDVWLIRNDWLPKHVAKLTAMPSGLGWASSKKEKEKDALIRIFSPAIVAQNSYEGTLYGLPLSVDSLALYVGSTALDNVIQQLNEAGDQRAVTLQVYPKTWAELETWVRIITQRNKNTITRPALALGPLANTYAATDVYTALLHQYKGTIYDNSGQVGLHLALADGSIPATQALDFFNSFSNPSSQNYTWNTSLGDPVKRFAAEELPLIIGYSSLRSELLRLNPNLIKVEVAPLPQLRQVVLPADERSDFAAYWTHVVPRSSANQQLAWRFIESLINQDSQSIYESRTLKPSYLTVPQQESSQISETNFDQTKVFAQQVYNAKPTLKPDWQFVDGVLQTMIKSVNDGVLGAQAAVDTGAQALKLGHL